jgi:FKBP-type peptidyl-prolyl cis-trans isomerase
MTFFTDMTMKIRLKLSTLAAIGGLLVLQPCVRAQDKSAKTELSTQKDKVSYSIGMSVGRNLKSGSYDVDVNVLAEAIKDVLAGKEPKLTEAQAREVMQAYSKELSAKREEERVKLAEKNHKAGEEFLAQNKTKPGVKTHTVALPDGTSAELQYKVITEGSGPMPKTNDIVTVNYRGTLINGKEFDSTAKHGQPLKRAANQLVRGWTEALTMMKTGSKWEIYVPSSLAYKDMPAGQDIEPGSTLIFEMELVSFEAPQPAPQSQPLTSDIIRVPSADELKKGAKIEVMKPEDVEKAKAEAAKQEKDKQALDKKKP